MRAINHALTGALIGLVVREPAVAIPAALVSHVICDMIPHHGSQSTDNKALRSKLFLNTLFLDALLCFSLVILLFMQQPGGWLLAVVCAFVAASPDFLFINRFLLAKAHKSWRPTRLVKFLCDIQWFQRPLGAVVEIAWFAAGTLLLLPFIR